MPEQTNAGSCLRATTVICNLTIGRFETFPGELSAVSRLLTAQTSEAYQSSRLKALSAEKLAELAEAIELRRARGIAAATALVQSDRGDDGSVPQIDSGDGHQIRAHHIPMESLAAALQGFVGRPHRF